MTDYLKMVRKARELALHRDDVGLDVLGDIIPALCDAIEALDNELRVTDFQLRATRGWADAQAAEIERLRKACLHVIEIDRLVGGAESSENARELRHLPDDSVVVGDLLEGMGIVHND